MENENEVPTLKTRGETFAKNLKIPVALYTRMVNEAGLKWGDVTQFILEAIEEKLQREGDRKFLKEK